MPVERLSAGELEQHVGDRPGICVVGGSVAGTAAAQALRTKGYDGEIRLIEAEAQLPYDRPPLSKQVLQGGLDLPALQFQSTADWSRLGITLSLGASVTELDSGQRVLRLSDGSELRASGVVLAPGTESRPLPFPDEQARVRRLRTLEDALVLRGSLRTARSIVLVGAGFIGLEVAATAVRLGLDVTVVELLPLPLAPAIGEVAAERVCAAHRDSGVTLLTSRSVAEVRGDGRVSTVVLDDGRAIEADIVVAGVGVRPATGWLAGSGLELGDGIEADAYCRTSADLVYAAGDAARWHNPAFGARMRVEHWSTAREQGATAAANLLGELRGEGAARTPFAHVPYFWSDQLDMKIQHVGRILAGGRSEVEHDGDGALFVTHRLGDRLTGATTINRPRDAMLSRRRISEECERLGPPNG